MVPVLKKLKVLTRLNLLPLLSYGASFDQFMTIKTFSKWIYISCVHRDTYLYVKRNMFGLFHDYFCSQSWIIIIYYFVDYVPYPQCKFNGAKFLESGKSSFRFLHVHSHIDPVNYIYVLQ